MQITVEFFGIPRERIGKPSIVVDFESQATVSDVIRGLEERYPRFAEDCAKDGQLAASCSVNLNGRRFICTADALVTDGDALLIMSADAGG